VWGHYTTLINGGRWIPDSGDAMEPETHRNNRLRDYGLQGFRASGILGFRVRFRVVDSVW